MEEPSMAGLAKAGSVLDPTGFHSAPQWARYSNIRLGRGDTGHRVVCVYCSESFDLFQAAWCTHAVVQRSKICPRCERCLCWHPGYDEARCWHVAPKSFQTRGFKRLFILYL
jgi:hypothetical protein